MLTPRESPLHIPAEITFKGWRWVDEGPGLRREELVAVTRLSYSRKELLEHSEGFDDQDAATMLIPETTATSY